MPSNPRQSTGSRQAEIIATMLALAAARNPADITTTDIAKAMGVTQGALFRHFSSKEAIRLAVAEWIEAHLMARLGEARQAAPDALQGLEAMFLAHVQFIRELPGVPRFVFAELQQPVAEALESAKAVQLIRLDLDCHAAAALFLGAIQGLVIQTMLGEVPAEIDERARGVLRLYLCGLGARP
jgi:AcrR family transcriptional regulator